MARYAAFLGRFVDVQYRAGDICLPASGTFVADSGRSIFLEQHYEQRGQRKNFRWEIPYQCIIRVEESETFREAATAQPAQLDESSTATGRELQANAAHASAAHASGGASLIPIAQRPKIA
jgi:hypothetical protein